MKLLNQFVNVSEDGEVVTLTEDGIITVVIAYELADAGWTVEEIEEYLGLDQGTAGTDTYHLEFKILMALGTLSGVIEKFQDYKHVVSEVNQIDAEAIERDEHGN